MAGPAPFLPNTAIIQYVFDNIWSVDQLEAYVVSYQPGGIALHVLRRTLGHGRINAARYSSLLSRTAVVLYCLGHVKTVHEVLLELLVFINPCHLTPDQVRAFESISPMWLGYGK
jgi:hypothetical protein